VAALAGIGASAPTGSGPAARVPRLIASPLAVQPGATLRLQGRGFASNVHVSLKAGPPHGTQTRIGGALPGLHGSFVAAIRIRAHAAPGALVVVACQDACRTKATVRFRIVAR
jgi:hypothetical protein